MGIYVKGKNLKDIIADGECEKYGIKIGNTISHGTVINTKDSRGRNIKKITRNTIYNGVKLSDLSPEELKVWIAAMAAKGENIEIL